MGQVRRESGRDRSNARGHLAGFEARKGRAEEELLQHERDVRILDLGDEMKRASRRRDDRRDEVDEHRDARDAPRKERAQIHVPLASLLELLHQLECEKLTGGLADDRIVVAIESRRQIRAGVDARAARRCQVEHGVTPSGVEVGEADLRVHGSVGRMSKPRTSMMTRAASVTPEISGPTSAPLTVARKAA